MNDVSEKNHLSFHQAIINFYKGYFDFRGVSTRAGYWWVQLAIILAYILLLCLTLLFGQFSTVFTSILVFIIFLFSLSLIIPEFALSIRRLRDTGVKSKSILAIYIVYFATYGVFIESFYSNLINSLSSIISSFTYTEIPSSTVGVMSSPWILFLFLVLQLFLSISTLMPTDMYATNSNNKVLLSIFKKL